MDQLGFNSGNLGIFESTWEYSGMTWGLYGNDLGMTWEYLGNSGRVRDMTNIVIVYSNVFRMLFLGWIGGKKDHSLVIAVKWNFWNREMNFT